MTDHDPCVCPVCREAGMRNNPDKMIAELRRKNEELEIGLRMTEEWIDGVGQLLGLERDLEGFWDMEEIEYTIDCLKRGGAE